MSETEGRRTPPAWLLALLSLGASGLLAGWWLSTLGGLHRPSAGRVTADLRVRVDSPELAARTFFEAMQQRRPRLARKAAVAAALTLDEGTITALRAFACDGRVAFSVDETHRLEPGGLQLLGELYCRKADAGASLRADFEVMQVPNGFRVVRMQLDGPAPP